MANQFIDSDLQELYDSFLVETGEILESLGSDLMLLEHEPKNYELLNRIFRGFHTIKGTSSFMGFEEIATITHHAEEILNKLRRDELTVSLAIIDMLLEVHDIISMLVERIKDGKIKPYDYSSIIQKIESLKIPSIVLPQVNDRSIIDNTSIETTVALQESESSTSDKETAVDKVLNNPDLFADSGDFTDEELILIQAAFDEVNKDLKNQKNKELEVEAKLKELELEKNELKSQVLEIKEIQATSGSPATPKASTESIRIDVARLETLMDLSGELVLGRNRLSQVVAQLDAEQTNKERLRELSETTAQVDFITSEIQSAVMKMRMVQIAKLYQKAPRIVRDLSKEFNKKIDLVLLGEETEIDRGIIEELNDPLVHMIRNSCDHGIESANERISSGKTANGTITINAYQEGNAIVLKISDDGKGMSPEFLKKKAIEKGIISPEAASNLTDKEALQLIFAPGFSTAAQVTSVSGRGVGMDVVRTNIQKLKGIIEIDSVLGKGSTFTIKLPLTLAIIQGLLVNSGKEEYAIPLSAVIEVVSVAQSKIYTVNGQEVIKIREEVSPLVRLDKVLNCKHLKNEIDGSYVVLVGYGIHRIGLVVDELLGQQEIVIKSLGEYLGTIPAIAGSTILGDGRVIMIIEVSELFNSIQK